MRGIILVTLIILAGVILCGCAGQGKTGKAGPVTRESLPVQDSGSGSGTGEQKNGEGTDTMNENNQTVSGKQEILNLNDTITISLRENPTTGYQWNVTVSGGLSIENETYAADKVEPGIAGSGGMHHWLLRGTVPGNQSIYAIYKRSWEPEKESDHRFVMNITVR
jgi:inhibitor of cysteine peptidase